MEVKHAILDDLWEEIRTELAEEQGIAALQVKFIDMVNKLTQREKEAFICERFLNWRAVWRNAHNGAWVGYRHATDEHQKSPSPIPNFYTNINDLEELLIKMADTVTQLNIGTIEGGWRSFALIKSNAATSGKPMKFKHAVAELAVLLSLEGVHV